MAVDRRTRTTAIAGFAVLLMGWLLATPPAAGFDEEAHLVRALGVADGQWQGAPPAVVRPDDLSTGLGRVFRLPGRWDQAATVPCFSDAARRDYATCISSALERQPDGPADYASHVGIYGPYAYLPAGLAAQLSTDAATSYLLGRVATALVCLALLGAAVSLVRTPVGLVAVLAAVTPTTLFLAATVGTNGIEVCAAVLFTVAGLALVRRRSGTAPWGRWAAAGAVLAVARPLGPAFVVLDLLAVALLAGRTGVAAAVRAAPRRAGAAAVAIAGAVAAAAWWALAAALPALAEPAARTVDKQSGLSLLPEATLLPRLVAHSLGSFGWGNDGRLAAPLYLVLALPVLTVLALAVASRDRRGRRAVLATATIAVTVAVVLDRLVGAPLGYTGPSGRYQLAVWVVVPLLAGAVAARRVRSVGQHRLLAAAAVLVGLGQALALLSHAQRYAVGVDGPLLLWRSAQWAPPGDWLTVVVLAVFGGACLTVAGLSAIGRAALRAEPDRKAASWSLEQGTGGEHGPTDETATVGRRRTWIC